MKLNTFLNALSMNIQYCVQHAVKSESDVQTVVIDISIDNGLVLSGFVILEDTKPHWFELTYTEEPSDLNVLKTVTNTGMNFQMILGDTMPQELVSAISAAIEKKGQKRVDMRTTTNQNLMEKVLTENEDLLTIFNTPVSYQMEISAE